MSERRETEIDPKGKATSGDSSVNWKLLAASAVGITTIGAAVFKIAGEAKGLTPELLVMGSVVVCIGLFLLLYPRTGAKIGGLVIVGGTCLYLWKEVGPTPTPTPTPTHGISWVPVAAGEVSLGKAAGLGSAAVPVEQFLADRSHR